MTTPAKATARRSRKDPPLHYVPLDHVQAPPIAHTKTSYRAPYLRRAIVAGLVAAAFLAPLLWIA